MDFGYLLNAGAICIFIVVVIGGLVVGLSALLTLILRRRALIDEERAVRMWRIRSVVLVVVGVLCLLTPVQPMVTGQGLVAGGAGVLAAGVLMTAGGIVWHAYLSERLSRGR